MNYDNTCRIIFVSNGRLLAGGDYFDFFVKSKRSDFGDFSVLKFFFLGLWHAWSQLVAANLDGFM